MGWGRVRATTCSACSPSAAAPTTSMSGSSPRIATNPSRTLAWSSATTTRSGSPVTGAPSGPDHPVGPAAARAQRAAQQQQALAQIPL